MNNTPPRQNAASQQIKPSITKTVRNWCISMYYKFPWYIKNMVDSVRLADSTHRLALPFYRAGGYFNKDFQEGKLKYISVGKNVSIGKGVRIQTLASYGSQTLFPRLIIEDNVSILPNFTALVEDTLLIKHDALIAENCSVITNNHGMDAESHLPYSMQPLTTAPVTIGEECWIGQNVTILSGVEIGKRSIIAAGAVVTKTIPPYAIAAGVPAKVIKRWNFTTHSWEDV